MKRYVGLDVSQDSCAMCILEEDGTRVFEGTCATDPDAIVQAISDQAGPVERIIHESGPLSIWLSRELMQRGAPVVCIDARAANKALSARMNKSDKSDAEALAQLARTGWYREVHIKSESSDRLRLLLSARDRLINPHSHRYRGAGTRSPEDLWHPSWTRARGPKPWELPRSTGRGCLR